MTAYLVCEGDRDAQLLKRVLPAELLNTVEIIAAGGLSAVKSLARSLIVRRQLPVLIAIDADVTIPAQVEERRKDIEEIVGSVAANTPFKVILSVPAIETIFFQDVSLLSRLLGYEPSHEMLGLAVYQPSQSLSQLIAESKKYHSQSQLVEQLTNEDLEILRRTSAIQEIIQFLQSVRETVDVL
jgi:hypothetical protein